MPFNPTLPANNSLADAAELRAQFNALKAEIDELRALIDTRTAEILANSAAPVQHIDEIPFAPSDPPTQSEVLQIVDQFNLLLAALKRTA